MDQLSAPEYDPIPYFEPAIRSTHNCYDYAINHLNPDQPKKSQPGRLELGNDLSGSEVSSCEFIEHRLQMDHPEITNSTLTEPCPNGFHKIGLMVDPDDDYHFIRQDNTGYWSHKPGNDLVTNRDFSGRLLLDPENADFNNTNAGLNYTDYCGYYCISEDGHFADGVIDQLSSL